MKLSDCIQQPGVDDDSITRALYQAISKAVRNDDPTADLPVSEVPVDDTDPELTEEQVDRLKAALSDGLRETLTGLLRLASQGSLPEQAELARELFTVISSQASVRLHIPSAFVAMFRGAHFGPSELRTQQIDQMKSTGELDYTDQTPDEVFDAAHLVWASENFTELETAERINRIQPFAHAMEAVLGTLFQMAQKFQGFVMSKFPPPQQITVPEKPKILVPGSEAFQKAQAQAKRPTPGT